MNVFYDDKKINKVIFTFFDNGGFINVGTAKSIKVETIYFQRLDNSLIGLYGSLNQAGEIVGISGLRD
jgi:hypothetical protein